MVPQALAVGGKILTTIWLSQRVGTEAPRLWAKASAATGPSLG